MRLSKVCTKCGVEKPYAEFHKHKRCIGGYNTVCKECRKPLSTAQWNKQTDEYKIWHRAKSRAKRKGLEFNIEVDDIIIPNVCPILGILMDVPSIDRHDSSKGYIKGNIVIMSNRANMLKNNGTLEEFKKIVKYLESCEI